MFNILPAPPRRPPVTPSSLLVVFSILSSFEVTNMASYKNVTCLVILEESADCTAYMELNESGRHPTNTYCMSLCLEKSTVIVAVV